jgi:hypothetical protein
LESNDKENAQKAEHEHIRQPHKGEVRSGFLTHLYLSQMHLEISPISKFSSRTR